MSSGSRGRGGKFSKPKRGGARHFSQRTNDDGEVVNMWAPRNQKEGDSSDEDDSDEDSSEEESSEEEGPSGGQSTLSREQRKEEQKKRKAAAIAKAKGVPQVGDMPTDSEEDDDSDDEDMPANPNHTAKARSQAAKPKVADPDAAPAPAAKGKAKDISQLSRREREALQAQQAKERYQKMHLEGKTDEAKADMERLKLIREKRATEAARREAEAAEKAEEAKAKLQETKGTGQTREEKMREAAMGKPAGGKKKK